MQNLNDGENMALGGAAAFVEAVILQPTIYWKNAAQQGRPFTLNPKLLYRGIGAALVNEMGQMALQYGMTGYIKRLVVGDVKRSMTMSEEIASAVAGGVFVAPFASAVECVMIQQQIEGTSLVRTPMLVVRRFGLSAILRGFTPCAIRDGIYVGGLLGVTPVLQDKLMAQHGLGTASAGFWASLSGGMIVGVATCPFDAMSTVMKGDLQRVQYGGFVDTVKKRMAGGVGMLFGGVFWRTVNITGTIYLANEARVRLGPVMFPDKY
eukprot:m.196022 g.196022  ORF g.196022 m.196022 type:complete len:265 (+) comp19676_c0_seq1:208-1002(+)